MRGHIAKRGNKYSFVIDIGRDPVTKKRRQKRVSGFTSEKKARKAMVDMMAELNRGTYVEPTNETFGKYLMSWLNHKEKRVAYSTYTHYRSYIINHIEPALGYLKMQDLRPMHLQRFYDALLDKDSLSKRSVHHIHRIITNCLNMAVKMGEIQTNIATVADPVRVSKIEQRFWNVEEVNNFLENSRDHIHFIAYYLGAFTGMRRGEVLGLKWDCVDLDNRKIYVQRAIKKSEDGYELNDLKNTSSYRSITMSEGLMFELKKHKNKQNEHKVKLGEDYNDEGFVAATKSGTFILPTNLSRSFRLRRDKLIKNGIELKKIRFHDLRHTHASLLFNLNVHPKIVQERLGHSSIEITMDTYSHMLPNMQESAAQKLDEMFDKTLDLKRDVTTS